MLLTVSGRTPGYVPPTEQKCYTAYLNNFTKTALRWKMKEKTT